MFLVKDEPNSRSSHLSSIYGRAGIYVMVDDIHIEIYLDIQLYSIVYGGGCLYVFEGTSAGLCGM